MRQRVGWNEQHLTTHDSNPPYRERIIIPRESKSQFPRAMSCRIAEHYFRLSGLSDQISGVFLKIIHLNWQLQRIITLYHFGILLKMTIINSILSPIQYLFFKYSFLNVGYVFTITKNCNWRNNNNS